MRFQLTRMRPVYWAVLVGIAWGAALIFSHSLRFDAFGVDEAAAHALLLNWSVSDRVISTVFVFGLPDLRCLLFLPLGLYWPGSLLAAKVFSLLMAFLATYALYRWSQRRVGPEAALIASGLFLIAPGLLTQIDSLGSGPYLLLSFAVGAWLDHRYRQAHRPLGGWFFLQLMLIAFVVSLHPIGLAYPAALILTWHRNPVDERQQKHIYIGVVFAITFEFILRMGWGDNLIWLENPMPALQSAISGALLTGTDFGLIAAVLAAVMLLGALIPIRRELGNDLLLAALVLASVAGLVVGNADWALVATAALLFVGAPGLIAANEAIPGHGLMAKRGLVLGLCFLLSLLFLQADKAHHLRIEGDQLGDVDQLILALVDEIKNTPVDDTLVMSQWPGKTMLVIKRPVLPLPPSFPDGETLLKNIQGVSHLMFDPFAEANHQLKANLSQISSQTETLTLQKDGVIVLIKKAEQEAETTPSSKKAN